MQNMQKVKWINGLIKQMFTPNSRLAQLSEHKIEDQSRTYWCKYESWELTKTLP